jgi:hypothetical protein
MSYSEWMNWGDVNGIESGWCSGVSCRPRQYCMDIAQTAGLASLGPNAGAKDWEAYGCVPFPFDV